MNAPQGELEARLEALVKARVPGCQALKGFERLSAGASQETYALTVETAGEDATYCLRRAPGGENTDDLEGRPGLRVEAQLIKLAGEAGVPEPKILHVLDEDDDLGDGFLMEWLDGETLGGRILRAEHLADVRPKLAYQCGEILARIHRLDLSASGIDRSLQVVQPAELIDLNWDRYKEYETPQPMIDYAARWLREHVPPPVTPMLTHGDFRNGNLIIAEEGVRAVLDWELAHLGDPMRDLGHLCTNSWRFGQTDLPVGGFGTYEDLFAGYESVSGQPVDAERVKFWVVFGSFWWSIGCLGMADHFRNGPDGSIERAAIGRRSSECQVDCVNLLIPGPVALVEASDLGGSLDMPRADELITGVRDYLRNDVMAETQGRLSFLARVAGNALDIVLREAAVGPAAKDQERKRLADILGKKGNLEILRWDLVRALRSGDMPLDEPGLADHLRQTVVQQVAIDQPKYSGFKTAVHWSGDNN